MRHVLFALAAAVTPVAVPAQEAVVPVAASTQEAVTPAALVADRVREVLRTPADPAGWGRLADALPEMALVGQADWESTLEAARLADSVSVASRAAEAPDRTAPPFAGWPVQPSQLLTLLTGVAVLGVLRSTVRPTRTARTSSPVNGARPAPTSTRSNRGRTSASSADPRPRGPRRAPNASASSTAPRAAGGAGRRTEVLAMARQGVPCPEIARRTGLAQDAVATLVGGLR